MVSVGVSRMGKTGVIFIEPGAKASSSYNCARVVGEWLLPVIRVSTDGLSSRMVHHLPYIDEADKGVTVSAHPVRDCVVRRRNTGILSVLQVSIGQQRSLGSGANRKWLRIRRRQEESAQHTLYGRLYGDCCCLTDQYNTTVWGLLSKFDVAVTDCSCLTV